MFPILALLSRDVRFVLALLAPLPARRRV